jgi:hypothetical protein
VLDFGLTLKERGVADNPRQSRINGTTDRAGNRRRRGLARQSPRPVFGERFTSCYGQQRPKRIRGPRCRGGEMTAADRFDLERFVTAQAPVFETVLAELRSGRKLTHWMWFIFPQLAGLGQSSTSRFCGITQDA